MKSERSKKNITFEFICSIESENGKSFYFSFLFPLFVAVFASK
jgi:hypothetical protein